jgi:hypothetical protein
LEIKNKGKKKIDFASLESLIAKSRIYHCYRHLSPTYLGPIIGIHLLDMVIVGLGGSPNEQETTSGKPNNNSLI